MKRENAGGGSKTVAGAGSRWGEAQASSGSSTWVRGWET